MFKILKTLSDRSILNKITWNNYIKENKRTFLSQAYYCQEVWDHRLNDPILQKLNLEELYYDIDQRFQKTRQVSAVDVDIFVNAVTDNSYNDELMDVVHKLRLSADSSNTLESTSHAVVRALTQHGNKEDLLQVLDDRLNYGIFLDFYTANLLMNTYWKNKDFTSGARVASQLMLQEDFNHPVSKNLSILHCYNYLLKPEGWPEYKKPEEPEEEVKIRVKYLRNPFDDDHFDLRDPKKIVGKTLANFAKGIDDSLYKSFHILGLALYDKPELFREAVSECSKKNLVLYKEIIDLVPEESEYKKDLADMKTESKNVQDLLETIVKKAVQDTCETDIANQCNLFIKWEKNRIDTLEEQKKRIQIAKRLSNIQDLKKALKEKETKLWFFSNEEQIELQIEAKKIYYPKRWFGKKKKPKKIEEGYVPPEISSKNLG